MSSGRRVRWIAVAAAAALAACSTLKWGYNHLDWLVEWQLGDVVSLTADQETAFTRHFRTHWRWHRTSQLPAYAADLRELADAAGGPLTLAQVQDFQVRVRAHGTRLWSQLQPDTIRLLQTLSDAQVEEVLAAGAERRREQNEELEGLDEAGLQERAAGNLQDALEDWAGRMTPDQAARVREWSRQARTDVPLQNAYFDGWTAAFAELLSQRHAAGFADRARRLFTEPEVPHRAEILALRAHNRARFAELMRDLSATLTPGQREHFREELRVLAQDLEELAAAAPEG